MKKYTLLVPDTQECLAYTVEYDSETVRLLAKNIPGLNQWHLDKCKPNELFSTGNEYEVKLGKRKFKLDYSEIVELFIMTKLAMQHHHSGMPEPNLMELKSL